MTPQVIAVHLLQARSVRRLLGCGCLAIVGLVALPLLLVAAMASGALSAVTGGVTPGSDPLSVGPTAVVIGSAEPLPTGSFRVTQGFGCTTAAFEPPPPAPYSCPPDATLPGAVRFHTGVDLAAATGTRVVAVAAGTVRVISSVGGFGLHVVLTALPEGTRPVAYLYGHLSAALVADGTTVAPGMTIGMVGSSGNSTGPHLHFEVDVGGIPVNPCSTFPAGYLAPPGVAAGGCVATAP